MGFFRGEPEQLPQTELRRAPRYTSPQQKEIIDQLQKFVKDRALPTATSFYDRIYDTSGEGLRALLDPQIRAFQERGLPSLFQQGTSILGEHGGSSALDSAFAESTQRLQENLAQQQLGFQADLLPQMLSLLQPALGDEEIGYLYTSPYIPRRPSGLEQLAGPVINLIRTLTGR